MRKINVSIDFDRRLAVEDIEASRAHVRMLREQLIINREDAHSILGGLDRIQEEIAENRFNFRESFEDIHMNIEGRLAELVGDAAGRLHTARSRNDQVATDFRLWIRNAIDKHDSAVRSLQASLIVQAEHNLATIKIERIAPWLGSPCRDVFSYRPRRDSRNARFRPADGKLPRWGV
jgi:argininosuccinate lyase